MSILLHSLWKLNGRKNEKQKHFGRMNERVIKNNFLSFCTDFIDLHGENFL